MITHTVPTNRSRNMALSLADTVLRVLEERDYQNVVQVSYTRGLDLSGTFEGAGGIGGLLARSHDFTNCNTTPHDGAPGTRTPEGLIRPAPAAPIPDTPPV
jgi:hypothetical protein